MSLLIKKFRESEQSNWKTTRQQNWNNFKRIQIFLFLLEQPRKLRHCHTLLCACQPTDWTLLVIFFHFVFENNLQIVEFRRAVHISTGELLSENLIRVVYAIFDKNDDKKVRSVNCVQRKLDKLFFPSSLWRSLNSVTNKILLSYHIKNLSESCLTVWVAKIR